MVLLAVLCYACRYSIVCLSYGLYGSIFIYYKAGFMYIWLYAYLRVQTYTNLPELAQSLSRVCLEFA